VARPCAEHLRKEIGLRCSYRAFEFLLLRQGPVHTGPTKSPKQHKAPRNQGFMSSEFQDSPPTPSTVSGYESGIKSALIEVQLGRKKVLLLGSYPEVSLEHARAARNRARDRVQAGNDPADEKREAKLALLVAQESSFEAVARAWHSRWVTGRC
jgi:hypothetical protein